MAVNLFTNGAGGNTWNTAGNWSQGTVPTATDGHVTTFDATSPNCTMGAARSCNNIDFTGYTNTLTMSTFTLTVAGNVTLDTGMNISGTGVLAITGTTSTVTSNGKTWPNALNFGFAASQVVTIVGDLTVTGAIGMSGNPSKTINKTTNEVIYANGGISYTTYVLLGTITIEVTSGTINGNFQVDMRLNGNVTIVTLIWGGAGKTFTYVSGTVTITTSFTVYAVGGCSMDTSGVTFSSVIVNLGNGTVTLLSTLKATTLTLGSYNITFAGSFGFEVSNLVCSGVSALTYTLANTVEYKVSTLFDCKASRTGSSILFTSDHASNKALLTVSPGATCQIKANFTRIDASGGRPLRTWNGTVTNCDNIVSFYDLKTATL